MARERSGFRLGKGRVLPDEAEAGHADDSDGAELLARSTFWSHVEDAEIRSHLLRDLVRTRSNSKMTQTAVARLTEMTQAAVTQLEGGEIDPRLSTLQRYARAVNCRIEVRVVVESAEQDGTHPVERAALSG